MKLAGLLVMPAGFLLTIAALVLFAEPMQQMGFGIPLLSLCDFDFDAFKIRGTSSRDTRRYQFSNTIVAGLSAECRSAPRSSGSGPGGGSAGAAHRHCHGGDGDWVFGVTAGAVSGGRSAARRVPSSFGFAFRRSRAPSLKQCRRQKLFASPSSPPLPASASRAQVCGFVFFPQT